MTEVLGLPLMRALERLEGEGIPVRCIEVSSRKGSKGNDARVIKTVRTDDGVTVYWARFQTTPREE